MTKEQAKLIAAPFAANKSNKSIIVTGDSGVFLNSERGPVQAFADSRKIDLYEFTQTDFGQAEGSENSNNDATGKKPKITKK
jgi:hypothetical protein